MVRIFPIFVITSSRVPSLYFLSRHTQECHKFKKTPNPLTICKTKEGHKCALNLFYLFRKFQVIFGSRRPQLQPERSFKSHSDFSDMLAAVGHFYQKSSFIKNNSKWLELEPLPYKNYISNKSFKIKTNKLSEFESNS